MMSRALVVRRLVVLALFGFLLLPLLPARAKAPAAVCNVRNTPYFTEYYGSVTIDGAPAPIGTVVEALNGQGVQAGCFVVTIPGLYGYLRVYGADGSTGTPGMGSNEVVTFRVNGAVATSTPAPVRWSDDKAQHQVGLSGQGVPSAVNNLTAQRADNGVKLTWTHVGGNVSHYEVWRSESPYFAPGAAGSAKISPNLPPPTSPGAPVEFTDTASHAGNPDVQDYYVVLAIGANGQPSPASNRVAAFDFRLQPGR